MDAIFNFSRGLPRLINSVCDNALLSPYSADQTAIDTRFIKTVVDQMLDLEQQARYLDARPPAPRATADEPIQAAPIGTTPPAETAPEHSVPPRSPVRSAEVSLPRLTPSNDARAAARDRARPSDNQTPYRHTAAEGSPNVNLDPDMGRIERLTELVRELTRDAEHAAAVLLESCEPSHPAGTASLRAFQIARPHAGSASDDVGTPRQAPLSSGARWPTRVPQPGSSVPGLRWQRRGGLRRLLEDSRQTLTALHRIAACAHTYTTPVDPDDSPCSGTDSTESPVGILAHDARHLAKVVGACSTA